MEIHEISTKLNKERPPKRIVLPRMKRRIKSDDSLTSLNNLDDGCLMHILSFLAPIPDRYNTALVCHRWRYLACHPRLWLRVDRFVKDLTQPGVFRNIESAVSAARPGDTILIGAGGNHHVSNIQIKKPLCLVGGGEIPDETTLICSRGSDSALELLSTCKLANLTVKAELGCCLLHRSGRLTIDGCVLQCETNPLDHLSYPIVSTAGDEDILGHVEVDETVVEKIRGNSVTVLQTRIEGGAKAVSTSGDLVLQRVRVMYSKAYLYFWFDVDYE
ncbi:PREDICTED: F-box protein SKIP5 isoform X1 [Camelina sativa]|uniref:F-box protein SKIP5 isoform X1 n=1 Tax=Camelina sativa TaxID=90675 RepID=A0ABM0ZHX3_CAMSA|nr:PREDICTED: F-box protein SKIP5 isoform X1 [Camelina sativa]